MRFREPDKLQFPGQIGLLWTTIARSFVMTPRQRFFPLAKRMSIVSWTVVLALFSAAASSAQELSKLPLRADATGGRR